MEKSKWLTYLWMLLWVVGLVILTVIINYFDHQVEDFVKSTFKFRIGFWFNLIFSIIFGVYIALIFVKKWSLSVNLKLLWCVTIPCTLISFYWPVMSNFERLGVPWWFVEISTSEVFGIVTGMTIILSLFSNKLNI